MKQGLNIDNKTKQMIVQNILHEDPICRAFLECVPDLKAKLLADEKALQRQTGRREITVRCGKCEAMYSPRSRCCPKCGFAPERSIL